MIAESPRLRLTWRRVLITEGIGLGAAYLMSLETGYYGGSINHPSLHFVFMSLYVFCIVPLALRAEEAIRRGARPIAVYPIVLLLNPLLACTVALATLRAYYWWFSILRADEHPLTFLTMGTHMSIYGTLGFFAFINQRTSDRMLEGVRRAELKRVQLDRHLVESRLATAEAQIDPTTLFNALGEIKRGLANREADIEKKLNDLIQALRNALARTAAVSTEGHDS
jgi:hypothetical protein